MKMLGCHSGGVGVSSVSSNAYHVFMQAGVIAQGLVQYLAAVASTQVWSSFGSWLRTIRPGAAPSEFVVTGALRNTLPGFLLNNHWPHGVTGDVKTNSALS